MNVWNLPELNPRRAAVFLAALALLTTAIAREFGPPPLAGPATSAAGEARWIPLASGIEIVHTLTTPWNDFQRVQIRVKGENVSSAILEMAVDRMTPHPAGVLDRAMRRATASISGVAGEHALTFNFSPIADSGGQLFRVRVSAVALTGVLTVAATPGGDLSMTAVGPNSSMAALLRSAMRGRPWPFSSPVVFWILLGVFSLAVSRLVVLAAEMSNDR